MVSFDIWNSGKDASQCGNNKPILSEENSYRRGELPSLVKQKFASSYEG
jgi:hypothetical protein